MNRPCIPCRGFLTLIALLVLDASGTGTANAAPAPGDGSAFHDHVVSEYLDAKWEQLEGELSAQKPPADLTPAQKADVDAIRKAMIECRPDWWKLIKAGKKINFRPVIWGHPFAATFDPQGKSSVLMSYVQSEVHLSVTWDVSEMDNPSPAEHGFSKGELNDLMVWLNLGMAQSWGDIPISSQVNISPDARVLLSRYLDFRANVAGACYGNPRARRWGLWLDLAAWMEKYSKMPTVMSRRAVGAMFAAEVVGHAERYRSIKLPDSLPDRVAEEKLAGHLKSWIEKHSLTLAEDQSLRDALKAFAAANTGKVRQSGLVTLPNGLSVALDPDADKQHAEKRDAWLVAHLKKQP